MSQKRSSNKSSAEINIGVEENSDLHLSTLGYYNEIDENSPLTTRVPGCHDDNPGSYRDVFKATGFGRWHILLLIQCGWANASDAVEIMCISFTIESLHDSMGVSPVQATWITVVLFLGMMFGGYIWGSLADMWGRRQVVIFSLSINGLFGVLSAFPKSYNLLLVFRFLSGLGAGGSLPVCFSYFSEFQQNEKRGSMISALATFWMAGNILAAGIAWLVIPPSFLFVVSPYGEQWRLFILICAVPSITSAFFFCLMPESPKYLMIKGKYNQAFTVLKNIYKFNNKQRNFPYTSIDPGDNVRNSRNNTNISVLPRMLRYTKLRTLRTVSRSCGRFFITVWKTLKYQFHAVCGTGWKTRKVSLLMACVYFSLAFGGYGLSMWLPYLMQKTEENMGSPCQGSFNHTKTASHNGTSMYTDVFIGAAAQLPANILTILVVDRIGGKNILVVSLFLSGISVLFLYIVKEKVEVILVSAAFNCVSTLAWNGLDVVTPEMYETSIRAAASGLLTALSRIASILGTAIFGVYMDTNCNVPILTVTAVLFFGSFSSIFLPNTRRVELQ